MTEVPSQFTWDVYVTAEEPIVTEGACRSAPSTLRAPGDAARFTTPYRGDFAMPSVISAPRAAGQHAPPPPPHFCLKGIS